MDPAARTRSAGVLAALAATNLTAQRSRLPADLAVPFGVLLLVIGARASGLRWDEMGLTGETVRRDLVAAGVGAVLTAAGVGGAALLPVADGVRHDDRYPTPASARRAALTHIPLAVALPEEVAFRGVLDAALRRHLPPRQATVWGAAAFGAWHALGATTLARENAGLARRVGIGRLGTAAGVGGTVLATAAAGLGFLVLRRRSGSVLPGIAVHWALNSSAALAAGRSHPSRGRHRGSGRAALQ